MPLDKALDERNTITLIVFILGHGQDALITSNKNGFFIALTPQRCFLSCCKWYLERRGFGNIWGRIGRVFLDDVF
ncbi:protein of unknown function (plasmid) [Vibrio harveyi]|nr:protein of unknown function [Vibrio harveyi]CAH1587092.1 protein of unknown function [Vibrio harveyi]CAH1592791.1 protein of unknown function [Vibrio harveyi]